jgi:Tol biopolymer transport system component
VTASSSGDLVIAEDGGNLELVLITRRGEVSPLVRLTGNEGSELAGPAFSPSGRHLYFSSQRGDAKGVTYEVTGPFRSSARGRSLPSLRSAG